MGVARPRLQEVAGLTSLLSESDCPPAAPQVLRHQPRDPHPVAAAGASQPHHQKVEIERSAEVPSTIRDLPRGKAATPQKKVATAGYQEMSGHPKAPPPTAAPHHNPYRMGNPPQRLEDPFQERGPPTRDGRRRDEPFRDGPFRQEEAGRIREAIARGAQSGTDPSQRIPNTGFLKEQFQHGIERERHFHRQVAADDEGFLNKAFRWAGLDGRDEALEEQKWGQRQVEIVSQILALGFTETQAVEAVRRTSSVEAAVEWIVKHT